MRPIYFVCAFVIFLLAASGVYIAFFGAKPRPHVALKPHDAAANEKTAPASPDNSSAKGTAAAEKPAATAAAPAAKPDTAATNAPAADTAANQKTKPASSGDRPNRSYVIITPGKASAGNPATANADPAAPAQPVLVPGKSITLQAKPMPLEPALPEATPPGGYSPPRAAMFTEMKPAPQQQFERVLSSIGEAEKPLAVKELNRFTAFQKPVVAVTFSPDGKKFAAGGAGRALMWELESREPAQTFAMKEVSGLAFSPDGAKLACAGPQIVQIWDSASGKQVHSWRTDANSMEMVVWCPDDRMIATVQKPARVRIWRVEDGAILNELAGSSIGFAVGGGGYVLGQKDGFSQTRWPRGPGRGVTRLGPAQSVGMSSDGNSGAIVLADGTVRIEDFTDNNGRLPNPTKKMFTKPAKHTTVAFLPGDFFLALYRGDSALDVWQANNGESAGANDADTSQVTCVALSPDGRRALSGYQDGSVRLFALPEPHATVSQEEWQYKRILRDELAAKEFHKLEEEAARLREHPGRINRAGFMQLRDYYVALAYPEELNEVTWSKRIEALQAWLDEKPESVAAHVALAESAIALAQQARGFGPASTVTAAGGQLYAERLIKAGKLLVAAEELKEKDPHLYYNQVNVAKGLGLPKAEVYKIVAKGYEIFPRYWPLYEAMAEYLLPRWHGEPGEVARFADESAEKVGGDRGQRIYGHIALRVCFYEGMAEMLQQGFTVEKMQAASLSMLEKFPESALFCNFACYMACLAKDQAKARELMPMTLNNPQLQIWKSRQELRKYASWAYDNNASQ